MPGTPIRLAAVAAGAVLLLTGGDVSFGTYFPFILMLGVMMVAAPGVPGGAIAAAAGLLVQMLGFGEARGLPCHVLLTKADKLGRGAQAQTLRQVRAELSEGQSVQLFSASSGLGVEEARERLAGWLQLGG